MALCKIYSNMWGIVKRFDGLLDGGYDVEMA